METFFHGGYPGLRVGEKILPKAVTKKENGTRNKSEWMWVDEKMVYITPDFQLAKGYANAYGTDDVFGGGHGWVYRIQPVGEVKEDPNSCKDFPSKVCKEAVVLEVVGKFKGGYQE